MIYNFLYTAKPVAVVFDVGLCGGGQWISRFQRNEGGIFYGERQHSFLMAGGHFYKTLIYVVYRLTVKSLARLTFSNIDIIQVVCI